MWLHGTNYRHDGDEGEYKRDDEGEREAATQVIWGKQAEIYLESKRGSINLKLTSWLIGQPASLKTLNSQVLKLIPPRDHSLSNHDSVELIEMREI